MYARFALMLAVFAASCGVGTTFASGAPEIVVDRADSGIFPESWLKDPIHAEAEVLPESERAPCREQVEKELAKYPAPVLQKELKRVHILGRLQYHGVATGGTRSSSVVYVVRNAKIDPARLANNLHAEFSSILLLNHRDGLDEAAWHECHPPGFTYRGSGVGAVKSGRASTELRDELHLEGFLNEYAKASLEEDFNSYAGRLFTGDPQLWRAIKEFPKVAAKAVLVIAFYEKIDPGFSREFFESLRPVD